MTATSARHSNKVLNRQAVNHASAELSSMCAPGQAGADETPEGRYSRQADYRLRSRVGWFAHCFALKKEDATVSGYVLKVRFGVSLTVMRAWGPSAHHPGG